MIAKPAKSYPFLIAGLAALVIIGLSVAIVLKEYRRHHALAEVSVLNTAEIIAQQIETSFDNADDFIQSIAARYQRDRVLGPDALVGLAENVALEVSKYKFVSRVGITDETGAVVINTGYSIHPPQRIDISDRDYFKRAKAGDNSLLFAGPLQTRAKGDWTLILARRLDDGTNTFLGIVYAVIPVDAIGAGFSRIDLGPKGIINLRTEDFAQVVRYPALSGKNSGIGNRNVSKTIQNLMQKNPGRDSYVYTAVAPIDHTKRVYAYRKFSRSPFWMTVGRACDDILSSLYQTILVMSALSLTMTSILFWGTRRLVAQSKNLEQRIQEKEQAEQRLKESESKLAAILNSLESYVYMKDTAGRYLYANDAVCKLFASEFAQIVGRSDSEFFDDATAANIMKNDTLIFETGETFRNEEQNTLRKTGTTATYLTVKLPLRRDDGGIYALCGISTDITDRIRAEEEMRNNRQFLRNITDHLPGMVGYWSSDLTCRFANKAYLDWFGKNPEQIEGVTAQALLGEAIYAASKEYIEKALKGEPQSFERIMVKMNGEEVDAWVQYVPDVIQEEVKGFFVFVSDITAIKKAQQERDQLTSQLQQAQKLESIGLLAGGVAHDFNNILTVIIGYCSLLEEELGLTEAHKALVTEIAASAEKAAQLTHGLLAFSRKQPLRIKDENLNEIVQHVHKFLARIIGEDIKFNSTCCGEELPVRVDKGQLEQVLINLATNARDAMPNGGTLFIKTEMVTLDHALDYILNYEFTPGSYALLTVTDTGMGIAKEHLHRIFEPFYTTKEVGKGTGLGMAIIYGIIRQHNGFINVVSEVGQGTTFRVYLPIQENQEKPITVTPISPPTGGSELILIAEDDPHVRSLVSRVLSSYGYQVILAENGEEAVEKFRAHQDRIDLVIMDMIMPKLNGMDAYREIQHIKPHTKVIFASGYTSDFLEKRGVTHEDIELLMKPVLPSELLRKVRAILDAPEI